MRVYVHPCLSLSVCLLYRCVCPDAISWCMAWWRPVFSPRLVPSAPRALNFASAALWTMPPKRAASEETQAETQACKRYRQAIDEVAEEYVCPITAELPIDPMTAEVTR